MALLTCAVSRLVTDTLPRSSSVAVRIMVGFTSHAKETIHDHAPAHSGRCIASGRAARRRGARHQRTLHARQPLDLPAAWQGRDPGWHQTPDVAGGARTEEADRPRDIE